MFQNNLYIKTVARIVLAAFLYSFVAFEPLYGLSAIGKDVQADATARAVVDGQLAKLVLSARQGRISEGAYCGNKRLVIFVQDLHCNPEVQRNISDILSFFDTKYGLKNIFVEGSPEGKTDLSLFTGIADPAIKERTLESLLKEGLLSGAIYYGAKNNKENVCGLEQWGLYKENAARMARLLSAKSASSLECAKINAMLDETMGLRCSGSLRTADYNYRQAEKSKDRYELLARTARNNDISLLQFPNLRRQVNVSAVGGRIKFRKLPADLQAFLKGIQEKTPYGVYKTLADKLSDDSRDGEFYLNLQEVAYTYAPALLRQGSGGQAGNVANFLEYVRLNYSVNPMSLVDEEGRFKLAVLNHNARTLIDRELVFMQAMTEKLNGFVTLGMTPADYAWFREHAEEYKVTLMKYYGAARTAEVRRILSDKELYAYYDINLERNDVFAKNLIGDGREVPADEMNSQILNLKTVSEYTEVIKHLAEFTRIDAVVTGGFHVETAKALKARCISYLTVTPNITKKATGDLYERMMSDRLTMKDFATSSLSPKCIDPAQVIALGDVATKFGLDPVAFTNVLARAANGVRDENGEGQIVISKDPNNQYVIAQLRQANGKVKTVTYIFSDGKFIKATAAGWDDEAPAIDSTPSADSLTTEGTIDRALKESWILRFFNKAFGPLGYAAVRVFISINRAPVWELEDIALAITDLALNPGEHDHIIYDTFMEAHKGGATTKRIEMMKKMADQCVQWSLDHDGVKVLVDHVLLLALHEQYNREHKWSNFWKLLVSKTSDALTTGDKSPTEMQFDNYVREGKILTTLADRVGVENPYVGGNFSIQWVMKTDPAYKRRAVELVDRKEVSKRLHARMYGDDPSKRIQIVPAAPVSGETRKEKIPRLVVGKTETLFDKESFVIGSNPNAVDLLVDDRLASRSHARVSVKDGKYYLEDLGSTNGTYLNGSKLKGRQQLKNGDLIEVGKTSIKFEIPRFKIGAETWVGPDGRNHGYRIDGGEDAGRSNSREKLVADFDNDKPLRDAYEKIKTEFELSRAGSQLSPSEQKMVLIKMVYDSISKIMYDGGWADRMVEMAKLEPNKTFLLGPNVIVPNRGVCRHMGLLCAAVIERLIKEGIEAGDEGYPKGAVYYVRDSKEGVENGPGHGWAVYRMTSGELVVLDVAQRNFGLMGDERNGMKFEGPQGKKYSYGSYLPDGIKGMEVTPAPIPTVAFNGIPAQFNQLVNPGPRAAREIPIAAVEQIDDQYAKELEAEVNKAAAKGLPELTALVEENLHAFEYTTGTFKRLIEGIKTGKYQMLHITKKFGLRFAVAQAIGYRSTPERGVTPQPVAQPENPALQAIGAVQAPDRQKITPVVRSRGFFETFAKSAATVRLALAGMLTGWLTLTGAGVLVASLVFSLAFPAIAAASLVAVSASIALTIRFGTMQAQQYKILRSLGTPGIPRGPTNDVNAALKAIHTIMAMYPALQLNFEITNCFDLPPEILAQLPLNVKLTPDTKLDDTEVAVPGKNNTIQINADAMKRLAALGDRAEVWALDPVSVLDHEVRHYEFRNRWPRISKLPFIEEIAVTMKDHVIAHQKTVQAAARPLINAERPVVAPRADRPMAVLCGDPYDGLREAYNNGGISAYVAAVESYAKEHNLPLSSNNAPLEGKEHVGRGGAGGVYVDKSSGDHAGEFVKQQVEPITDTDLQARKTSSDAQLLAQKDLELLHTTLENSIAMLREAENVVKLEAEGVREGIPTLLSMGITPDGLVWTNMVSLKHAKSLADKWKDLNSAQQAEVLWTVALILSDIHSKRIVHSDIKPLNILVDDDLNVNIIDFGTAVPVGAQSIASTPGFLRIMQLREPRVPAYDIYSFGKMIEFLYNPPNRQLTVEDGEPTTLKLETIKDQALLSIVQKIYDVNNPVTSLEEILQTLGKIARDARKKSTASTPAILPAADDSKNDIEEIENPEFLTTPETFDEYLIQVAFKDALAGEGITDKVQQINRAHELFNALSPDRQEALRKDASENFAPVYELGTSQAALDELAAGKKGNAYKEFLYAHNTTRLPNWLWKYTRQSRALQAGLAAMLEVVTNLAGNGDISVIAMTATQIMFSKLSAGQQANVNLQDLASQIEALLRSPTVTALNLTPGLLANIAAHAAWNMTHGEGERLTVMGVSAHQRHMRADELFNFNFMLKQTGGKSAFKGYTVVDCIGVGGFGAIYLATNDQTGKTVAIKTLRVDLRKDQDARAKLVREREFLRTAKNSRFPKVLEDSVTQSAEGTPYLVMEYIQAPTLAQWIEQRKDMENTPEYTRTCLEIARQTAEALAYLHGRGLIHRDIKPENIMVIENKGRITVKVIDMGLLIEENEKQGKGKHGSLGYMTKEQKLNGPADKTFDIFALGVVMLAMFDHEQVDLFKNGNPDLKGAMQMLADRLDAVSPKLAQKITDLINNTTNGQAQDINAVSNDLEAALKVSGQRSNGSMVTKKTRVVSRLVSITALALAMLGITQGKSLAETNARKPVPAMSNAGKAPVAAVDDSLPVRERAEQITDRLMGTEGFADDFGDHVFSGGITGYQMLQGANTAADRQSVMKAVRMILRAWQRRMACRYLKHNRSGRFCLPGCKCSDLLCGC